MKSRYYRSTRYIPKAKTAPQNPSRTYEYYKMMWQAAHPGATHEEYEAWNRRIVKELEL